MKCLDKICRSISIHGMCWHIHCIVTEKCILCRNFTSAHTIRVESGLSGAMEQYDKNFKIRRIMGDELSTRSPENTKSGGDVRRASLTGKSH